MRRRAEDEGDPLAGEIARFLDRLQRDDLEVVGGDHNCRDDQIGAPREQADQRELDRAGGLGLAGDDRLGAEEADIEQDHARVDVVLPEDAGGLADVLVRIADVRAGGQANPGQCLRDREPGLACEDRCCAGGGKHPAAIDSMRHVRSPLGPKWMVFPRSPCVACLGAPDASTGVVPGDSRDAAVASVAAWGQYQLFPGGLGDTDGRSAWN